MMLQTYQEKAARTSHLHTAPWASPKERLAMAALWLASEAGEVAEEARQVVGARDEVGYFMAKDRMADELGDLLWMVAECCTLLDINLEDVARVQLRKQERRYADLVRLHDTEGE
ncbi:MAG: MazG nucleotide pyrophosphohydrolase domain-containing protein [Candidatus Limnocylindrus sp.]